jgi:hypothetical protein
MAWHVCSVDEINELYKITGETGDGKKNFRREIPVSWFWYMTPDYVHEYTSIRGIRILSQMRLQPIPDNGPPCKKM